MLSHWASIKICSPLPSPKGEAGFWASKESGVSVFLFVGRFAPVERPCDSIGRKPGRIERCT